MAEERVAQLEEQMAQMAAAADKALQEANERAQEQHNAAIARQTEAQQLREELAARGATGGGMDPTMMAQAFAAAFEAAGLGARRPEASSSSRKPGRAMPIFKGESGAQYLLFERQFRAWCDFAKLTDEERKTQLYLAFDGSAAQIVDIFGPGSPVFTGNDFQGYATQIKSLFATRAQSEAAKSAFEVTVQAAGESVQQYAARKLAKFVTAYPDVDHTTSEHLIRVFIKDLRHEKVREQVVLQGGKDYGKNFQGVVTAASNMEAGLEVLENIKSAKGNTPQVKVVPVKASSSEEPMELGAIMAALQPMMKESVDSRTVLAALQQQFRPRRDKNGRFLRGQQRRGGYQNQGNRDGCWECGEQGHFQRNCPKNRGQGGSSRGRGEGWRGNQRGRGSGSWRGMNSMTEQQQNESTGQESNRQSEAASGGITTATESGASGQVRQGGARSGGAKEQDF